MANNSKFVLRWEIDNATAVHAAGKVEPKIFNEGGFEWKIIMERDSDRESVAKITLGCDLDQHRHWKCEANVTMQLMRTDGTSAGRHYEQFSFNEDNTLWCPDFELAWDAFTRPIFLFNDKFVLEFPIHIISSDRGEPIHAAAARFTAPNSRSDVILKIGEEKLHVSKEYLAVQSPVFEAMFFGDYSEKGKEEVEIKDVIYEEFLDLLNVVYLEREIRSRTMPHILKLADRFQIKNVVELSQKHLMRSKDIDTVQKLIMADQYRLVAVRDYCLNSFTSAAELSDKLKNSPDVLGFSDGMKVAIFNRHYNLSRVSIS